MIICLIQNDHNHRNIHQIHLEQHQMNLINRIYHYLQGRKINQCLLNHFYDLSVCQYT
jgi:hypothetical protein